jgi:hypothetical protein
MVELGREFETSIGDGKSCLERCLCWKDPVQEMALTEVTVEMSVSGTGK